MTDAILLGRTTMPLTDTTTTGQAISGASQLFHFFFTDLLYIAIRDSLEDELEQTLRDVCRCGARALFAFEERALEEEAAFMSRITEGEDGLSSEEIPSENFDMSVIQPEGEFAALLWEAPSMRFFWLRQKTSEGGRK